HCVHGKSASVEEILDWRPYDYFTIQNDVRMPLLRPFRTTYELEDTPTGTRVTEYTAAGGGFGQRFLLRSASRLMAGQLARGQQALQAAAAKAVEPPSQAPE
ncbi:MAG TPA: hypothetical protein VFV59_01585, partial [Candidatus Limnocylindria bacterium]|nr:hypothetical protein [Candidatus Limnocylindria bacterium]